MFSFFNKCIGNNDKAFILGDAEFQDRIPRSGQGWSMSKMAEWRWRENYVFLISCECGPELTGLVFGIGIGAKSFERRKARTEVNLIQSNKPL